MKKYIISAIALLTITFGCTNGFDDLNKDPNKLTEVGPREMPYMFAKAQSSSALNRSFYQTVQNLGADLFSQYFALTTTSFSTDRYVLTPDWQRRFWSVVYVDTAPQLKAIIENAEKNSGEQALANILWVYTFHRLADHFGPIPYFDAAEAKDDIAYDALDKIYDDFFKRLDVAVKDLKALPEGATVFKGYDLMYNGDVKQWISFANTLRLRLALRISHVDANRAKVEAEAAVKLGVMTDNGQNAYLTKSESGNDTNGLSQVAAWNEFAMSSTMASYLKGYNDPRLKTYFQPNVTTNSYNGLRNGLPSTAFSDSRNSAQMNSNVGEYWATVKSDKTFLPNLTAKYHVMCAAEAYMLRAEGALNNWDMGGTAQSLYEEGIKISFRQWNVVDDNYLTEVRLPAAPGDANNSPAVSTTPTKWASDKETQMNQVLTQKWLAMFPNGMEAWAEFRRTGYPKMYEVVQSDNTDIPQGEFIRRLPYPQTEIINNKEQVDKGIQLLGGKDNAATRLWWDVK